VKIEEIPEVLPYLTVLDVAAIGEITFRLVGTGIVQMNDRELKGRNVRDITAPEFMELRERRHLILMTHPCASRIVLRRQMDAANTMALELVGLPVAPAKEGDPMQEFSTMAPLDQLLLRNTASQDTTDAAHEIHQFIDIGAGVPDAALGLSQHDPLTL